MTLEQRVKELVERHGSLRAAGRVVQLDPAYLHRLASGEKAAPSKDVLQRLGLRRIVTYEPLKTPNAALTGGAAVPVESTVGQRRLR